MMLFGRWREARSVQPGLGGRARGLQPLFRRFVDDFQQRGGNSPKCRRAVGEGTPRSGKVVRLDRARRSAQWWHEPSGLTFGIFWHRFTAWAENPTLAIARDMELSYGDHLGYDEAWIGEHHSAGWSSSPPELVIAAPPSARDTSMLGSGVTSLPYHNPLARGPALRALDQHDARTAPWLGCGAGALVSDATCWASSP